MDLLVKKISILLLLITTLAFIGCGNKENCFLCNGYGKLPCAICEKGQIEKEVCQFCDGYGQSICSLCNGTGIEKNKEGK